MQKESRNILGLEFFLSKFQFSGSDNLDDESGEEEGEPMEEDTPAEEKVGISQFYHIRLPLQLTLNYLI